MWTYFYSVQANNLTESPAAPIINADDYAANTGTTGSVAVGGSRTGNIETSGDRDWLFSWTQALTQSI